MSALRWACSGAWPRRQVFPGCRTSAPSDGFSRAGGGRRGSPRSGRAGRDRHTPQQPRGRRGATPRVRGVRAAADDLRTRRAGELDAGTLDEECQADDLLQAATWASRVSPPSICPVRRAGNGVARDTLRAWHRCRPRGRRFLEAENRRWNR